uniref:CSON000408 protein n=1 Tax=Culicoides sonorensis TaxID=179676 RepID=A0A336LPP4_CULSO
MISSKVIIVCAFVTVLLAVASIAPTDASPPANSKLQQLIRKSRQTVTQTRECNKDEQCKWVVYTGGIPTYEIMNDCHCKNCVKKNDDVSISAYVYRCQNGS